MSLRFEDVIVQKPPARRVYCEHSLVTWRAPLRGEDSDNDGAPSAAANSAAAKPGTTFFGAVESEQAVMTTEAMMAVAMRSLRWIIVNSLRPPLRCTDPRFPDLHCAPYAWGASWRHAARI